MRSVKVKIRSTLTRRGASSLGPHQG
jgi:hypothetical protein